MASPLTGIQVGWTSTSCNDQLSLDLTGCRSFLSELLGHFGLWSALRVAVRARVVPGQASSSLRILWPGGLVCSAEVREVCERTPLKLPGRSAAPPASPPAFAGPDWLPIRVTTHW